MGAKNGETKPSRLHGVTKIRKPVVTSTTYRGSKINTGEERTRNRVWERSWTGDDPLTDRGLESVVEDRGVAPLGKREYTNRKNRG